MLTYRPPPPLDDFVDLFWIYERSAPVHGQERVLPTGSMQLVADVSEHAALRVPVLCGAFSESFLIDTSQAASLVGVHFKPGGAFPFLPVTAGELHNQHAALDELWGNQAGALQVRLMEARTPLEKCRVLADALLDQATRPLERHGAVAYALDAFNRSSFQTVGQVMDRIGMSRRRVIQVFTEEVGLTPKLYCRIQRFQQVLRLIHGRKHVAWAQVALSCGYYDQAHFNHDFHAFSGLNPSSYLARQGRHPNHVPVTD